MELRKSDSFEQLADAVSRLSDNQKRMLSEKISNQVSSPGKGRKVQKRKSLLEMLLSFPVMSGAELKRYQNARANLNASLGRLNA